MQVMRLLADRSSVGDRGNAPVFPKPSREKMGVMAFTQRDDPTDPPVTIQPTPPPVTVTVPANPSVVVSTVEATKTVTPVPSVKEVTSTATATVTKTLAARTAKPKVVYRTKTAEPKVEPNPIPGTIPESNSTIKPEGDLTFPPMVGSPNPVQSQPGIVIQLPPTHQVADDSNPLQWVIITLALMFALTIGTLIFVIWRVLRRK